MNIDLYDDILIKESKSGKKKSDMLIGKCQLKEDIQILLKK